MQLTHIESARATNPNIVTRMIGTWGLALMISGLFASPLLADDLLRLSLEGQLNDDGLSANADYDNATFSGFFEIDLSKRLSNPAGVKFYEMTAWTSDLVPEPPNPNDAPMIRFSGNGEPDDRGEVFLDRSNNRISIPIEEDNAPSSRSILAQFRPEFPKRGHRWFL